jgi:hypothetical protein
MRNFGLPCFACVCIGLVRYSGPIAFLGLYCTLQCTLSGFRWIYEADHEVKPLKVHSKVQERI